MVGIYLMHDLRLVNLHVRPVLLGANMVGAAVFGIGMLLLHWAVILPLVILGVAALRWLDRRGP